MHNFLNGKLSTCSEELFIFARICGPFFRGGVVGGGGGVSVETCFFKTCVSQINTGLLMPLKN